MAASEKAAASARAAEDEEEEAQEEARPRSWGTPSHTLVADGAWTSEDVEDVRSGEDHDALDLVVESF